MRRIIPAISIVVSFLSVAVAAVLTYFVGVIYSPIEINPWILLCCCGAVGAGIAYRVARLTLPFIWITGITPLVAGVIIFQETVPFTWFFFIGFAVLASLHLPALWTHVPYYPTPDSVDHGIGQIIESAKHSVQTPGHTHRSTHTLKVVDLGCGTARMLARLSVEHSDVFFEGYEISVIPFCIAKIRSLFYRNLTVRFSSFWSIPLKPYTVVYAFLSPAVMPRLAQKVADELDESAVFISNSFSIPETYLKKNTARSFSVQTVSGHEHGSETDPERGTELYIYRLTPR